MSVASTPFGTLSGTTVIATLQAPTLSPAVERAMARKAAQVAALGDDIIAEDTAAYASPIHGCCCSRSEAPGRKGAH